MSDLEVIDEVGVELDVVRHEAPVNLFRTEEPTEIVARATQTATALADVLKDRKLTSTISGREHVRVEGWTLLGSMLGVFPVCVWTRKLDDGWEARVEARTLAGAVVGAAEAECLRSERTWAGRDDFALRSMAQTRATSKALRQPLGFVVSLAGYEATPAEEMTGGGANGDEIDRLIELSQKATRPSEMPVHFGKNKGVLLGSLNPRQLGWYASEWQVQEDPSEYDHRLKAAAVALAGGDDSEIQFDPDHDVPFG